MPTNTVFDETHDTLLPLYKYITDIYRDQCIHAKNQQAVHTDPIGPPMHAKTRKRSTRALQFGMSALLLRVSYLWWMMSRTTPRKKQIEPTVM